MKFFMVRRIYYIYRGDIVTVCMFFKFPLLCNPPSLSLSASLLLLSLLCTLFGFYLFIFFTHCLQNTLCLPHPCLLSFDSFKFPMLSVAPFAHYAPGRKPLRYSSLIILMRLNASLSWNFIYLYLIFKQLWQIYALLWRKLLQASYTREREGGGGRAAPWAPLCVAKGAQLEISQRRHCGCWGCLCLCCLLIMFCPTRKSCSRRCGVLNRALYMAAIWCLNVVRGCVPSLFLSISLSLSF